MGTAGREHESTRMSAHAATHDELFETGGRSLRDAIDLRKAGLAAVAAAVVVAALVTALPGAYGAVSKGIGKLGHADLRRPVPALGLGGPSVVGPTALFPAG